MNFLELASTRYSSRSYQKKEVEEWKLLKVLEAARIAPSAVNKQPWVLYVIRQPDKLALIKEAYHREWFKDSPVVIVACGKREEAWTRASDRKSHLDIDVAIAVDHMTLQATELGLATCWICNFDPEKCKSILHLPDYLEPIVILPLAYPADTSNPRRHETSRKPLEKLVIWDF
jgi:nitroreductase